MTLPEPTDERARHLFEALKAIAAECERGSTEVLAKVHALLGDYFLEVTTPYGRSDNKIEQRMVGSLWAELEEIIDRRTNGKR
ncbi:MAG: hypothetical protein V3T05_00410 [Myxococcota bacterium]